MTEPCVSCDALRAELEAMRSVLTPEMLGEAVHTALRKGCDGGMAAHRAIADMPGDQWSRAMEFAVDGLLLQAAHATGPAQGGSGEG